MAHHRKGEMSDFLFAAPSVLSGAGRVIDLMGLYDRYNMSPTPKEADARALFSDWLAVVRDLSKAMTALRPTETADAK